MDASSKYRVLVAVVATVMVLSALAVLFDNPSGNMGSAVLSNNAGYTASGASVPAYTYAVSFINLGLPAGTSWSVTVDGNNTLSSTGTTITFQLPNGSHSFTVGKPSSYIADPASGVVFVYGQSVVTYVTFSLHKYSLTFVENGLPSGSQWSVNLSGDIETTTSNQIIYNVPNGSYSFYVTAPQYYSSDPASGNAIVYGQNTTIDLALTSTLHRITFNFGGDISGTSWDLVFDQQTYTVSGSSMTLMRENGMYQYSITPADKYSATPASGSVLVLDNNTDVNVTISLITYQVTFEHEGIVVGTPWSVTFDGQTQTSNSSVITFTVPIGTYTYTISEVNGYSTSNSSGQVSVASQDQVQKIEFTKNPDVFRTPLLMLAGAAAGVAGGIGIGLLISRRGRKP